MHKAIVRLVLFIITLFILCSLSFGTIINVPNDYLTIQGAVDNSISGDTILVENGTYTENISVDTKELIIVSQYAFSGDTLDIGATLLDGSNIDHVINLSYFAGKIQGFKMTNGNNSAGGGILIYQSPKTTGDSAVICDNIFEDNQNCGVFAWESKALIRNNTFSNNYTDYCGAGVYSYYNDSSTITGNLFTGNNAELAGGAISCQDNSNSIIENNIIIGNTAIVYNGGGIFTLNLDSSTISGNIFRDNVAAVYGGAICCDSTYNEIENNTIFNNTAPDGGGLVIRDYTDVIFSRNIVSQNSGGGIYDLSGGFGGIVLSCNDVWGNTGGDAYYGCTPGVDDISVDPIFCEFTTDNFGIDFTSPCAAANNSCGVLIGAKDIGCMPVTLGYIPDLAMGYETGNGVSVFIGDGEGDFGSEQNNYSVLCQDLATGDFDNDGNLDIVATDAFWEIKIYSGDGTGAMSGPATISYDQPYAVATGDFDGTNGTDFVVSDVTGDFIDVYLNNGSGGFSHYGQYGVGAYPVDIDTGHFNADAFLDLVVVNESDNSVSILLNDGYGGFGPKDDKIVGTIPKQVEVADFNDDTYLDFAVTNNGDDNITLYFGDGTGAFSGEQQFSVGNEPWGIEIGYFNFDYFPDLVVTNYADNDISILVNDGTGDFSDRTDYETGAGASPNDVAVGHLNDDGMLDLVVCHRASNTMDILLNNGSNQFPTTTPISCNNYPFVVLLDDFNNDSYAVPPVSFHVTNTDNDGDGSLRWAITEANNNPGPDTILFDISGTIYPLSNYPSLYDPDGTVILGSSAPGKAGSVTIDLSSSSFPTGIFIDSKHNIVEGLNFTNGQHGIWLQADSNIIINNHIDYMSSSGININNNAMFNRIGGYNAGEGNLIEYCTNYGIALSWDSNRVIGNRISHIITEAVWGVGIDIAGCNNNLIDSNIIDSCSNNGINVRSYAYYNTISRNQIFGNGNLGIDLDNDGVTLNDTDDLDNGSNGLLNYPELDSIHINDDNSYGIFGSADTLARVEFFRASTELDTTIQPDSSGYGEARDYIGYTTCDNDGKFVDTIPQSYAWSKICMTTTDTSGNTSEFSYNFNLLPAPFIVFAWADVPEKTRGQSDSVINLRVTDPTGDVIGRDAFDVLEQTLFPADYVETGLIDSINIPVPEYGEYNIEILGEDGSPTDATYTMGIRIDGSLSLYVIEGMSVPTSGGVPDSVIYVVEAGWHYINGDANCDDVINIFDVTFLISYLYKDGEAPYPETAGDSNCDLVVNIFDVTYLITYLYKEGPYPCNNPEVGD